jgi:3-hydroxy-9,10-secoandrosta-1,3,5(10)-triene-9,17-dione monooxygenase
MATATTSTDNADPAADVPRARTLLPVLRERAANADRDRRISAETISELRALGLIDLQKPRRFGGRGGSLADAVAVSRELASGCLSTGWVHGVFSGHLMFLSHFPLQTQMEVYADPGALVSAVLRAGRAEVVSDAQGFYLRNVEGRFCSGVDHCTWVLVGADAPGGERRFFLVSRDQIEIVDDWHTSGMRGTGSKAIRIAEAYVPTSRSVSYDTMCDGTSPGALGLEEPFFAQPVDLITPYTLIGNSLGGAFAALETVAGLLARKPPAPGRPPGPSPALLARLGEAGAAVDAAYAVVLRDATALDARVGGEGVGAEEKARLWGNRSYAAQSARRVVNDLFELGGGSGLYDDSPLQRWWRDVNGACNHVGVARDPAMASHGRAMLDEQLADRR